MTDKGDFTKMGYSIGKAAEITGMSAFTLRYYEKEGLLPFVERTTSGTRCFKESDFEWLSLIQCLKNTGMSIKDIKEFVGWCMEGEETLEKRLAMFLAQKKEVEARMTEFRSYLDKLDWKIKFYENAIAEARKKKA